MYGRESLERKNYTLSLLALLLTLAVFLSGCGANQGNNMPEPGSVEDEARLTADYLKQSSGNPNIGSVGGDWMVIGIAESGLEVEDGYFDIYYDNVRAIVKSEKGILSENNMTEYARVSLALSAIGKDPTDVEKYNLLDSLDDEEKVLDQGKNAIAYALIASNVAGEKLAFEDKYLSVLTDWLDKEESYKKAKSTDYTAMTIHALSYYQDRDDVKKLIDKAVQALSDNQSDDGSFGNCESTAECIMALTSLGIDPVNDERFIKEGKSLVDGLMSFQSGGGFIHSKKSEDGDNMMSTEKALLALCSIKAFNENGKGIF